MHDTPTESAGDRSAVAAGIAVAMNTKRHINDRYQDATDAAISALRARGVSRQDMVNLRADLQLHQAHITILSNDREDLREEIARLRATLEKIARPGDFTLPAEWAREALNAGAKP